MSRKRSLSSPAGRALDAADDELMQLVDRAMAEAIRRAGPLFGCGPGRGDCCRGLFPINLLDARRLQRGMTELAARDPARAAAVRRRASRAVRRLARDFPGNPGTGLFGGDEEAEAGFCARHGAKRCPALDGATGRCDVYEWRPVACRAMGPPVRLGGVDLSPCPYCFGPASAADVERCRALPDPEGRESGLLDALEAREDRRGETVIPFALVGLPPTRR
ncbi:MAG: YkgJ family cysteine cluster protein [Acidobacteria bacterium]|nr:YkgJ family cysteine cluster protein [Acidobacteriota bacterium]